MPSDIARARPSLVLCRIKLRSNSAIPDSTVGIRRPCALVVSAQGSPSDLKPAPSLPIRSMILSRSSVERASRSSLVTTRLVPHYRNPSSIDPKIGRLSGELAYLPAPAPIVTPSITSPPGYPRLLASARREPIEPAQWPQPHHPWGCWILAGRAARSRSNNLVISTTEPHAALPYQGSGHWRPASRLSRKGSFFAQMTEQSLISLTFSAFV